jgi:uncharacterized membrane protein YbhN (UPF0104 family)
MALLTVRQKQQLLGLYAVAFLILLGLGLTFQFLMEFPPLAWTIIALIVVCVASWAVPEAIGYRRRRRAAAPEAEPDEVPRYDNEAVDSPAMQIVEANRKAGIAHVSITRARRRASEPIARFKGGADR